MGYHTLLASLPRRIALALMGITSTRFACHHIRRVSNTRVSTFMFIDEARWQATIYFCKEQPSATLFSRQLKLFFQICRFLYLVMPFLFPD